MSFNRGMKRDYGNNRNNFGNNRNMGGGGGNNIASRLGNIVGGGGGGGGGGVGGGVGVGNVNPWEGGMMPGGRGILPTPNNNISLASPQAQLAIASNLISNLLRNQQDTQTQVPSLLSLGNNFNAPNSNYNNQQNYNQGRFDRIGRQNMKNQRPQPYNKMGNRARDGVVGRRPQQNRNQSGNQRQNGNQNQRNDRSSKANSPSKQNLNIKKEPQEKTSDKTNEKAEASVALSEENDDSEESKKREWKDEKKEVFHDNKKDEPMKNEDETANKEDEKSGNKRSAARHAESRYADVPMSSMFCHVCKKHMWDGASFENHLRGRAHQLMMDKLDESYKLKVELMRHELRVAEEQRELSLNNSKRRGKKLNVDLNVREYCTMCDLNFFGTLSSHRKGEKHQQLKTFLHPRCLSCSKEFPSRIEYDEHCLTPAHMKNACEQEEKKKLNKKDKLGKGESEVRSAEDEEKDVGSDSKSDKIDDLADSSDFVLDIPEGEIGTKLKIPTYRHVKSRQMSIGRSLVKEVVGFNCDKCRRFMLTEEDMIAHLRSATHYRSFIQEIKTLQAEAEKAAKEAKKQDPDDSKNDSEEKLDNHIKTENESESTKIDRKRKHGDDDDDEDEDEDLDDDKYDPAEVNDESEEETVENEKKEEEEEEEEKQEEKPDESNVITLNEPEDTILEESNDHEEEEEEEKEPPKSSPVVSKSPARGGGAGRARGNRARRSRR
ncbi:hypothetical protein TKK_0000794 [Trichogramma kaykai]|uniref:C2H2-type domain-containing protein n=1 Tax=Trichogramma kaykai TaxID=54128 RepID=A0ABD2WPN3_9HYME